MEFDALPTMRPPVLSRKYVVTSGHYLASMAGARVLEMGGNVVDAGVATGLCLNVVQPDLTSIGGVAPIILRTAQSRAVVTISGLGWWPKAATIEALTARGGDWSSGILATVMPAAIGAWLRALAEYGTMPLGAVAAPAIELAEEGFPVNRFLASNLARAAGKLAQWPSSRAVYLSRGRAPRPGELLVQQDVGRTLRLLVEAERGHSRVAGLRAAHDRFYTGEIAQGMVSLNQEMGGFLTADDLARVRRGG